MRYMLIVLALLLALVVSTPSVFAQTAPAASVCSGNILVLFAQEVSGERPRELIAIVEQAILRYGIGTPQSFTQQQPQNITEASQRGQLANINCIIEIYAARLVASKNLSEKGSVWVWKTVFLGLRFLVVQNNGVTTAPIRIESAEGRHTGHDLALFGNPSVDENSVFLAALEDAANKILSRLKQ